MTVLRLLLLLTLTPFLAAQAPDASAPSAALPDGPSPAQATLTGTVTDANEDIIPGAQLTLEAPGLPARTLTLDNTGLFSFPGLPAGDVQLTVAASGFTTRVLNGIALRPGETVRLAAVVLAPGTTSSVDVIYTRHEMAEEQIKAEEHQRVLGLVPNFYTTYNWNAAPLSSGQKFKLALRSSVDPMDFVGAAVIAGIEQSQNDYSGYGQGAQGYAKRFGAAYADDAISTFIGSAILPSILHQDPRYFYKGTGSIRSRALYAISTVVITKGDNGRWQPNYSNVLGNLAAAGISNIYYPSTDRNGARLTIDNALIGTASGAIGALFQEFLVKHISTGVHSGKQ